MVNAIGYDGMARFKYWPDSVLLDCLLRVATLGGADRLLLGGDVARRTAFRSYGGLPGMAYLPRRFVPVWPRWGERIWSAGYWSTAPHGISASHPRRAPDPTPGRRRIRYL